MTRRLPTFQEKALFEALRARGITVEEQFWDGHKHVDLFIPSASLIVEVDGPPHFLDPERLANDLERDLFSWMEERDTIRIPNEYVERFLPELVDALAHLVAHRVAFPHDRM